MLRFLFPRVLLAIFFVFFSGVWPPTPPILGVRASYHSGLAKAAMRIGPNGVLLMDRLYAEIRLWKAHGGGTRLDLLGDSPTEEEIYAVLEQGSEEADLRRRNRRARRRAYAGSLASPHAIGGGFSEKPLEGRGATTSSHEHDAATSACEEEQPSKPSSHPGEVVLGTNISSILGQRLPMTKPRTTKSTNASELPFLPKISTKVDGTAIDPEDLEGDMHVDFDRLSEYYRFEYLLDRERRHFLNITDFVLQEFPYPHTSYAQIEKPITPFRLHPAVVGWRKLRRRWRNNAGRSVASASTSVVLSCESSEGTGCSATSARDRGFAAFMSRVHVQSQRSLQARALRQKEQEGKSVAQSPSTSVAGVPDPRGYRQQSPDLVMACETSWRHEGLKPMRSWRDVLPFVTRNISRAFSVAWSHDVGTEHYYGLGRPPSPEGKARAWDHWERQRAKGEQKNDFLFDLTKDGDIYAFGILGGWSLSQIREFETFRKNFLWGFDSFEGFPEEKKEAVVSPTQETPAEPEQPRSHLDKKLPRQPLTGYTILYAVTK